MVQFFCDKNKKEFFILFILVVFLFIVNYSFLDAVVVDFFSGREFVEVERVIDGDTIVVNGISVRLLGINCPERGERFSFEATDFLKELILNESVELGKVVVDKDKYGRLLRYVFVDGVNVNLELVRNGLANFYYPSSKDVYYNDFKLAWDDCMERDVNLCERSIDVCSECIVLRDLNVKNQKVVLYNSCGFDCDLDGWSIKDEGRKKFVFSDFVLSGYSEVVVGVGEGDLVWDREDYVWTSGGDSFFLRDEKGKLVLFYNY